MNLAISSYWDVNFWQFFATLFLRIPILLRGEGNLQADELQILILSCIAISCGLLGPLLILKKMVMLANSLSHTVLLGLASSYLIAHLFFTSLTSLPFLYLFVGAIISALITVFCTGLLTRIFRLQEDASVGLVFTSLFALGVIIVTLFMKDVHLGIEVVMGNADALQREDLSLAVKLAGINAALIFLFYWPLQLTSFDKNLAVSLGVRSGILHLGILTLVAMSCIVSFRAVGVLLVLSFLVGPYLIARLFSNRLFLLFILTPAVGIIVSIVGIALARHLLTCYELALSTGGIVSTLFYITYVLCRSLRSLSYRVPYWRLLKS